MKKTNTKVVTNTTATTTKANNELANLTREQLSARYKSNIAERKRLSAENKELVAFWKKAGKQKTVKPVEVKPVAKAKAKPVAKKTK